MDSGIFLVRLMIGTLLPLVTLGLNVSSAQQPTTAARQSSSNQQPSNNNPPPPSAGFRPIGSSSPVDAFRRSRVTASRPQTGANNGDSQIQLSLEGQQNSLPLPDEVGVQPATFTQDGFAMPDMPAGNYGTGGQVAAPVTGGAAPPVNSKSAAPTSPPATNYGTNPAPLARGASPVTPLPQNPVPSTTSASDLTPVPTPQMGAQDWSTTGTSPLVTGPSGYRAVFWDCSTPQVVPTSGSPYVYAPPTVMPNSPQAVALTSYPYAGIRPIFTLGQENYNVQLGQGIIGQPTVYVPGQPIRNFFRYLSP